MSRAGYRFSMLLIGSIFFFAVPAHSQVVVLDIEGTLGSNVFCCSPNTAATYPIPSLFGGSFSGTFEYDLSAPPIVPPGLNAEFPFASLNIEIRDNVGGLVYTIDNSININNLRVIQDGSRVLLAFGQSAGLLGVPSDLRVSLAGPFTTGNTPPAPSEIANAPIQFSSPFPFLEIDAAPFSSWDLNITSVEISERPVPTQESSWGRIKALYGRTH